MADLSIEEITESKLESLKEHYLRRGVLYAAIEAMTFSGTSLEQKLLIRNGGASGINAIIFEVTGMLDIAATTSQLNQIVVDIRRNPTVTTTGTAVTSSGNRKSGSSDSHALQLFGQPTVTGGSAITGEICINTVAKTGPFFLEPGDDLVVSCRVNDASNSGFLQIIWAEDNV